MCNKGIEGVIKGLRVINWIEYVIEGIEYVIKGLSV